MSLPKYFQTSLASLRDSTTVILSFQRTRYHAIVESRSAADRAYIETFSNDIWNFWNTVYGINLEARCVRFIAEQAGLKRRTYVIKYWQFIFRRKLFSTERRNNSNR